MKTSLFLLIVLISGAMAGLVHGSSNLVLVEPYLDEAIGIENQNLFASGEEEDTPQFWVEYNSYRDWQKGGQILAGTILGTSVGALFGIVYALSIRVLPGKTDLRKSFALAAMMWLTIYFIPFLKYPANPPTVGDGETVVLRAILYLSFIAISGFGAVGFYQIYKRLKQNTKILAFAGYAAFIGIVFAFLGEVFDTSMGTIEDVEELIETGVISGGMIPKVHTALSAIREGVRAVVIIDGRKPNACLLELFTTYGAGSMIRA